MRKRKIPDSIVLDFHRRLAVETGQRNVKVMVASECYRTKQQRERSPELPALLIEDTFSCNVKLATISSIPRRRIEQTKPYGVEDRDQL